jgi:NAD(P)H-dependent flavin oxidoreductase YrpB (nitropropane dioxygenase family)
MLHTRICELFKIDLPILSAGMGTVAHARLAAAVSEAGGLGTIALAGFTLEAIASEIARARSLTDKPIAVNLLIPFMRPGSLEVLAREKVEAVTFFWGDPAEQIPAAKKLGLTVVWQCGSADEAARAKAAGADAIIAQGFEAGGHVRGIVTTLALVPEVRDAIGDLPMLAAGGLADGRGLAAALALGANGAVFGTRFIASKESAAHPDYKQRIVAAHAAETFHTKLYDVGWPDAAHRTLRTPLVEEWERAGCPESGRRPREGLSSAKLVRPGLELPMANYSVSPPSEDMEGDLGGLAWYAGQSVTQVREILPAGEIVRRIADEARAIIATRLAPLAG